MKTILLILACFVLSSLFDRLFAAELKEEPMIESIDILLKQAKPQIACADYAKLKASIAKDIAAYRTDRSFFEPKSNTGAKPSFIVFDKKSWTLSICDKGNVTSAVLDTKRLEDSHIDIDRAYLTDMNGDGKTEFLLGDLQCVEGPCLGDFYLLQLDGGSIRKINKIHTTLHHLKDVGKEKVFELKKVCFTHEFGVAFEWFSVGAFKGGKNLKAIPFADIKKKYPSLIGDYESEMKDQIKRAKEFPADKLNETYLKVSQLLLRAYKGEAAEKLQAEYSALIKPFEKTGGLPIYCDPKDLISTIAK
jgi:hypothetical protein